MKHLLLIVLLLFTATMFAQEIVVLHVNAKWNAHNDYTDIKDKAIEQRVDYYTDVINISLENNAPLSSKDERNIRLFIDQVDEMKSDYDKNIAQKQYVQNVL